MSARSKDVLEKALSLSPIERAELVEEILSSFDFPARERIDALWANEAEERIDAFEEGELPSSPAKDVFNKIDR
jgi:putative addiction module component (TIGR02574 family)